MLNLNTKVSENGLLQGNLYAEINVSQFFLCGIIVFFPKDNNNKYVFFVATKKEEQVEALYYCHFF